MLNRFLMFLESCIRGYRPQRYPLLLTLCFLVAGFPANASADELTLEANRPRGYIALAPTVAGVYRDSGWDSAISGEIYLAKTTDSRRLSVFGAAVGGTRFAAYERYRLSLDLYLGTRILLDSPVGLSLGSVVDVFDTGRARVGIRSSIWYYIGVMPYISITSLHGLGAPNAPELEVGIKIPFPAFRW